MVIDIIRKGLLETPIYVNISNWGPVIPTLKSIKSAQSGKKEKTSAPQSNETSPNEGKSGVVRSKIQWMKNLLCFRLSCNSHLLCNNKKLFETEVLHFYSSTFIFATSVHFPYTVTSSLHAPFSNCAKFRVTQMSIIMSQLNRLISISV